MEENQEIKPGTVNPANSKKISSAPQKSSETDDDKNMKEGQEFIREGHGHDYSQPIAGEDGGTEDQSGNYGKRITEDSETSQTSEKEQTPEEESTT